MHRKEAFRVNKIRVYIAFEKINHSIFKYLGEDRVFDIFLDLLYNLGILGLEFAY